MGEQCFILCASTLHALSSYNLTIEKQNEANQFSAFQKKKKKHINMVL